MTDTTVCIHQVYCEVDRGKPFKRPWTCSIKVWPEMFLDGKTYTRDDTLCCLDGCLDFRPYHGRYDLDGIMRLALKLIEPDVASGDMVSLSQNWIVQAMGITLEDLMKRGEQTKGRVIAFDASTTAVGWATLDDGVIEQGVFKPNSKGQWYVRISEIRGWGMDVILAGDTVLYEIASGQNGNMKTNRMLGAVEYVFRMLCLEQDAEFNPVTTSQIKTTGLLKNPEAAADWCGQTLHANTKPHRTDIADALGMIAFYTGNPYTQVDKEPNP